MITDRSENPDEQHNPVEESSMDTGVTDSAEFYLPYDESPAVPAWDEQQDEGHERPAGAALQVEAPAAPEWADVQREYADLPYDEPEIWAEQRDEIQAQFVEPDFQGNVDEYPASGTEFAAPTSTEPGWGSVSPRLRELNVAIEVYPDAAVNYVLRGEYFLETRQLHLAEADFETALSLAEKQVETDSWGIVNQYVVDRALMGLNSIEQRMA
jgi:hypothetical protein